MRQFGLKLYFRFEESTRNQKWRGFPEYGCGAIGDMACHLLGAPNMALRLTAPVSVECVLQEGKNKLTYPSKTVLRYDFPARGNMPPVKIFWHDGLKEPFTHEAVPAGEQLGDQDNNGSLFIGAKGLMTTGCLGVGTRLVPASKMKDYKFPPELLTRSPGHYRDWIRACKGGEHSCSNFSVAGPFVQWMLLGIIAMKYEGKLQWDAKNMRITNNHEANKWLKPTFHKSWKFVG